MQMHKSTKKLLSYILILFFLSSMAAIYAVQITGVTGSSMEPELADGQSVIVNKICYGKDKPERFDVVVFRYLYKDGEYYIKRVIGLPGETVQIKGGELYVDGLKLSDPFSEEPIADAGRASEPVTLGEDEYFVMGDNRNYSSDSREADVGNVKQVQILGKAVMKLWPFEKIRQIK